MGKKQISKKPTLRSFSKQMASADELEELVSWIDKADARASALVLAAWLDGLLERAIRMNFVDMGEEKFNALFRDDSAPLQSFSSKIKMAHALGIFDDNLKRQVDILRKIRNFFAHAIKTVDFEAPIVAQECLKLDLQKVTHGNYEPENDTSKEKFISMALFIGLHLYEYFTFRKNEISSGRASSPKPFLGKYE
jgi:hypothetical protein